LVTLTRLEYKEDNRTFLNQRYVGA
jgi:hypothetical protein